MSPIQAVTVLATLLGLIATVLNLVAFVREKDRSHTRAGLAALLLIVGSLALLFLPRYAPGAAQRVAAALPGSMGGLVQPWLSTASSSGVVFAEPSRSGVLGSFTIEIQRNLFGGIGALVSDFQFSNASQQAVRVTAYHVRITRKVGEAPRSYDRVLAEPLTVPAGGNEKAQVELDAEIRDQWVAREDLEPAERGAVEISWDCQDAAGAHFQVASSNG